MKIPFVTFIPMERELDKELRAAFTRVFENSWYIDGVEDKAFEEKFVYCSTYAGCPAFCQRIGGGNCT